MLKRDDSNNSALYIDTDHLLANREPECDEFDEQMLVNPVSIVVSNLASNERMDRYSFAKKLRNAKALVFPEKNICTIGTYFYSVSNGGTERVMSRLCYLWLQMGYQVVLITENRDQEEYDFPDGIQRVYIPDHSCAEGKCYYERAKALQKCIEEYKIDVVVYHAWELTIALWDELIIKASKAAFVFHCHNVFTKLLIDTNIHALLNSTNDLKGLVTPALLSDAVITLSQVDKTFWKNFNDNVFQVNNPFTGNYSEWKRSSCEGHNILWVARISPEKRPYDVIAIMERVLQYVPDAQLHIVGSGWDKNYEKQFRQTIAKKNFSQKIVLHGYQRDVLPFYAKATLFLMTSEFEGYPMTLQESMASGLPIVMYSLPHLTVTQNNPGIVTVEQGDVDAAARSIAELLLDEEKRKQMGMESRKYMDKLMEYDYEGTWRNIIESLGQSHPQGTPDQQEMMETLILHQHIGASRKLEVMKYNERKMVKIALRFVRIKDGIHEKRMKRHSKKEG